MTAILATVMMMPVAAEKPAERLIEHPMIKRMHQWNAYYRGGTAPKLDERLCRLAQQHANYMARTGDFNHGQNDQIIAYGTSRVGATFSMWMNSPGHRFWVMSNSRRCGFGCQISANGTYYWVGCYR